jgi:hypothetical protein
LVNSLVRAGLKSGLRLPIRELVDGLTVERRGELTDRQQALIVPLLPPPRTGCPAIDHGQMVNASFWVSSARDTVLSGFCPCCMAQ